MWSTIYITGDIYRPQCMYITPYWNGMCWRNIYRVTNSKGSGVEVCCVEPCEAMTQIPVKQDSGYHGLVDGQHSHKFTHSSLILEYTKARGYYKMNSSISAMNRTVCANHLKTTLPVQLIGDWMEMMSLYKQSDMISILSSLVHQGTAVIFKGLFLSIRQRGREEADTLVAGA